jgi:hypothetical protein
LLIIDFFLCRTNEVEIILGSAYQNSDTDEGKLIISFPSIGGGEAFCFNWSYTLLVISLIFNAVQKHFPKNKEKHLIYYELQ